MAPCTQRQHATAETAPVAHSTNTSMHAGPWPKVTAAESEVSLGKHALSPEEGPTSDVDQRRATPGFPKPKPANNIYLTIRVLDTRACPPHLELTDDEETPSNVPPNHMRKLRRMETLMIEDDNDSVHDKFSSGTETKSLESESNEEEECDDLVGLTQTAKMSKMAFEASISYFRRPSWLANSAEDITDTTNIGQTDWHHSPPNSVPVCIPATHGTLPPCAQAGAHVLSGGLTGIQPEDSQTTGLELMDTGTASEGQQMTRTHSVYPQVTVSGTKGTTSEGPQATHMRSEGHSEGRQAACTHSTYRPVTVSGLKGELIAPPLRVDDQYLCTLMGTLKFSPQDSQAPLPKVKQWHMHIPSTIKLLPRDLQVQLLRANMERKHILSTPKPLPPQPHGNGQLKPTCVSPPQQRPS
ncbi:hypothetical protein EDB83DRAFT_2529177 [Lactarius deliciosus]|nr:hypothetical protein EDB83DRAFT_2529177 [Lactarius deliciosus]